jgi:drug/metabolite transporter (DMT)-like permease
MAGFASVLAYVIYFWVLRHMTAARLGAFGYLHPVLTTVMGIVLLGEKLTGHVALGGGLVLVGVYLIESGPRENQLKENSRKE